MTANLSFPAILALVALVSLMLLVGCAAAIDARATAREERWMAENPPVGELMRVNGRQVHLFESGRAAGTAPDLVLIHGANGNLRDFTFELTQRLESDFRILAVDRPGLGWSETLGELDSDPRAQARHLRAALAKRGLRRPIVLGHSYGGAVAMAWALDAPQDTAALVIIGGATHPWDGSLGLWYRINAGPLGRAGRAMVSAMAPESAARAVLASVFEPHPVPGGYADHFGTGLSMRRASQAANARQVNALNDQLQRMHQDYSRLSLPIELLHGEADTIVGLEIHSAQLESAVASARLARIEGAGHMLHHSHPEAVVAAIHRATTRAGLR